LSTKNSEGAAPGVKVKKCRLKKGAFGRGHLEKKTEGGRCPRVMGISEGEHLRGGGMTKFFVTMNMEKKTYFKTLIVRNRYHNLFITKWGGKKGWRKRRKNSNKGTLSKLAKGGLCEQTQGTKRRREKAGARWTPEASSRGVKPDLEGVGSKGGPKKQ